MKRVYRRCHACGLEWNVSKIAPGEKVYICPTCELKRRIKGCTTARAVEKH